MNKCKIHGTLLNGFATFTFCNACDVAAAAPVTNVSTDSKELITDGLRISNVRITNAKQVVVGSGNVGHGSPHVVNSTTLLVIPDFIFHKQAGGKTQLNSGFKLHQFKTGYHLQGVDLALVCKSAVHFTYTGKNTIDGLSIYEVVTQAVVKVHETRLFAGNHIKLNGVTFKVW